MLPASLRKVISYDWQWFDNAARSLAGTMTEDGYVPQNIYGVPRGGLFLATRLSYLLDVPMVNDEALISINTLIVDDISDSGKTLKQLISRLQARDGGILDYWTACLEVTPDNCLHVPSYFYQVQPGDAWSTYPWEAGAESDTVSKVRP